MSDKVKIILKAMQEDIDALAKLKQSEIKKNKELEPKSGDKKKKRSMEEIFNSKFQESTQDFEDDFNQSNAKFEKMYKSTLKKWKKARKSYIDRMEDYQNGLVDESILVPSGMSDKVQNSRVIDKDPSTSLKLSEVKQYIIPGSFDIPIRDQGKRGTCSSFAAIRALESVMAQNGVEADLSEQYFYWLSKPDCQTAVCSQRGAWFGQGLINSQKSKVIDIPSENNCPYNSQPILENETQIPLKKGCKEGVVKVLEFGRTHGSYLKNQLFHNRPIIAAFKLSPNFYTTKGFITLTDSNKQGNEDSHSAGHAVLLVGFIVLPESLHQEEGRVCYLTANSWSVGWGKGGYGCLSEKWVQKYSLAFMSLGSVISKN